MPVWQTPRTHIRDSIKRRLFHALVTPFFTYAPLTWPDYRTHEKAIHHTVTRMLRIALNEKPPVDKNGNVRTGRVAHTETLYGYYLTVPAELQRQRLTLFGHLMSENTEGRRLHVAAWVLSWSPCLLQFPRRRGGQIKTVRRTIFEGLVPQTTQKRTPLVRQCVQQREPYRHRVWRAVKTTENRLMEQVLDARKHYTAVQNTSYNAIRQQTLRKLDRAKQKEFERDQLKAMRTRLST